MSDTIITDEEKKKAKNRLHGLIVDEVSAVAAGANGDKEWVIMKDGEQQDLENADKAVWSTAAVNDLPDSSFLLISPGGTKDDEGKTTPRSLRHLPYKDGDGKIDLPHLRNAIARIPQMEGISQEEKDRLQERARGILEDATQEDTQKSADVAGAEEPPMPEPVKIEKSEEKLDRARDILWGAMDKLKERLYPADVAAQNAVLSAVVAAVGGADTDVLMSEDNIAKAEDAIVEAITKIVEAEPILKSAFAVGSRPVAPADPPIESPPAAEPPEDITKAGKPQLSCKRAAQFREAMGAMVKLLHEMDPALEKEALWPTPAKKSADAPPPAEPPTPTEIEKRAETLEAENARLRAELAKEQRRTAPSNIQTDEHPAAPINKSTTPRLNVMNLNDGFALEDENARLRSALTKTGAQPQGGGPRRLNPMNLNEVM